ncbi:esterase [Gordonia phage Clown]|uniref:Esterase n=1 Tax=Gordonia phage Clown TaxID=2759393 RepID=A0A7L7STK0_9CAUD|nr:head decoration [Gordonia phage Clown]QOC56039.1 esterase [Gordonia phage Clown]
MPDDVRMGSRSRKKKTSWWQHSWGGATIWGWAFIAASTLSVIAVIVFAAHRPIPHSTESHAPQTAPAEEANRTIAFLGDSYTAGAGAAPRQGYPERTALADLGCYTVRGFGSGGTGYTNPGPQGAGTFKQRVGQVIAARPGVVVVQGSTNDRDPAATGAAADAVFTELAAGLPDAVIVAVGPAPALKHNPDEFITVSAAIQAAAERNGVRFIDPTGWLSAADYTSDQVHPNDAGHLKYGTTLRKALLITSGIEEC